MKNLHGCFDSLYVIPKTRVDKCTFVISAYFLIGAWLRRKMDDEKDTYCLWRVRKPIM